VPPSFQGSVLPQLYPLAVVYAPPGSAVGTASSVSSVSYTDGSTLGSNAKTTYTFKSDVTDTAEASIFGFATLSDAYGWTTTQGDEWSLDIKKSQSTTIAATGAMVDGLNHDLDTVYVWLNPQLDVVRQANHVTWSLSVANGGPTMDILYLYVSELRNPSSMRQGVAQRLAAYGISLTDTELFANLLALDPLANGGTTIDPTRYVPLPMNFPFEPPPSPTVSPNTTNFRIDNASIVTTSVTNSQDITVGYSFGFDLGVPAGLKDFFTVKTTEANKLTWTQGSVDANSTGTTQSAQVTVTGPSFGYSGPVDLSVYYDGLYGTFMFAPAAQPLSVSGTVTDANGQPLVGQEVDLATAGGTVYRTFTGLQGDYRVYGAPAGLATLTAAGVSEAIAIGATPTSGNLTAAR
jgi:hypothetical protein